MPSLGRSPAVAGTVAQPDGGPSGQSEIGKSGGVMIGGGLREAAEDDAPNAARCRGEFSRNRSDGDARGAVSRKSVDAGRDGRKRERDKTVGGGEVERGAIARRQHLILATSAAAPHRTNGVDDVLCRQPITARDFCCTGCAAAELFAFRAQRRSGRAMDRTIDAAATEQGAVRRVDDCVERKRRNVGHADFEPGGADFSSEERRIVRHFVTVSRPLGARLGPQIDGALLADIVEMLIHEAPRRALAAHVQHLKKIVVG